MTSVHAPGLDPVIRAIEAQRPSHPTYAGHLYHALTYGWLVGEVIRRVGGVMQGRFVLGGYGDARARELTLALGHALGA